MIASASFEILRLFQQILRSHDARVVDHHVQRRILLRHRRGERANGLRALNVQLRRPHTRIRRRRLLQRLLPPSRDDHRVAQRLKCLRQSAPDAGATAGNKNGVARKLHLFISSYAQISCALLVHVLKREAAQIERMRGLRLRVQCIEWIRIRRYRREAPDLSRPQIHHHAPIHLLAAIR